MADYTITLTADEIAALEASFSTEDLATTLQSYVQSLADQYILIRVKEEEAKKDVATRKAAISGFTIKPAVK